MSIKVKKWNKMGLWPQMRSFCITNYNLYNFNNNKLRRVIPIRSLEGITKNLSNNSKEFVIHVTNEPDYRLSCDQRQLFIDTIKVSYATLKNSNIKIFGVQTSKNLGDFATTEKDC